MFRQRSLLFAALLAVQGVNKTVSANKFTPKVPEDCLKMGFCEDVPDYPTAHVDNLIKQLGSQIDKYKVQIDATTVLSRNGVEDLCASNHRTIVPMAAPDKDGQWHYVVNQKSRPLQSFIVEVCASPGAACSNVAVFHTGYDASCKQKFIYRNAPSLGGGGEMVEKQLMFPSSCACQFGQTDA
ncbi:protein spaetzle 5-like [Leguminivora glycinivorella]|uniref:protein spaetzle 5-like n=1 Tax=Leguminivora glycinivorella TaxID=1035111 RepID=UPI00200EAA26|nr:protein spaetzle 5-like [Leguminivora glycinivorella]